MELQDRLQEIRTSHGQHTGRKCEVCWMLAELDRQNADARVVAADKALRLAGIERDSALADAEMWRNNVKEMADRLLEMQKSMLLARDKATREVAAAGSRAGDYARELEKMDARFASLWNDVTALWHNKSVLPQTPRVLEFVSGLAAALERAKS